MEGSITIGIPAYNEEKTIVDSVQSALDSLPKVMEIIVVASGCTDRTPQIVRQIAGREKRVRVFIEKERKGKGSALNIIFREAQGKFIVMTDGDLTFPRNSVKELIKKFSGNTGVVSGKPTYFAKHPMFRWWAGFASECADRQRIKRKEFFGISGYLYAIKAGIIKSIPSKVKSEDAYVTEIVRQKNYRIGYAEKAIVRVGYPENMKDYLTQKIRTHFGHFEVFKKAGADNPAKSIVMAGSLRGEIGEYFKVANELIKSPAQFLYFASYLCTEVTVWAIAFLKFYLKGEEKWKHIESTKKHD